MEHFEELYGRRCKSSVGWFEVEEYSVLGPKIIYEALDKVRMINRLKTLIVDKNHMPSKEEVNLYMK